MPHLRQATAKDQPAIMSLIDSVYREYGDQLFVAGADSDLLDIETNYLQRGGDFMVLEESQGQDNSESASTLLTEAKQPGGIVRGTIAVVPWPERQVCKLHRLYLDPALRGTGCGSQLMDWALAWAQQRELARMEFWSDVRFKRAHAFYSRYGFQQGEIRAMTDGFIPYEEHFFWRDLG